MNSWILRVGIVLPVLGATIASTTSEAQAAGIHILSFDQASRNQTELGSEYEIETSNLFEPRWQLLTGNGDAYGRLSFRRLRLHEARPALRVALWGQIEQRRILPPEMAKNATGVSIELSSSCNSVVRLHVEDAEGRTIASTHWRIGTKPRRYRLKANMSDATTLIFGFDSEYEASDCGRIDVDIDDLVIENGEEAPFTPPLEDSAFLDWLFRSSFNFFDWNFVEVSSTEGVVLERQDQLNQVSSSGQGYAIAVYIIASENDLLDHAEAHRRVTSIVNWLYRQDWAGGANGWHGFPYHWYKIDKTPHWPAVSTIDWAMLAAGLRVARQYFAEDADLTEKISEILARPNWQEAVRPDDYIGMGFNAEDGTLDPYRWGLAFSEESELVYLEALASDPSIARLLHNVRRERKFGFCPSWFASGFTYNWLQLWTGPLPHLEGNSRKAFAFDLYTNMQAFDRPLIGLTAAQTMTAIDENGFLVRPNYFSNQGAVAHLTPNSNEVIQIAPAPYGAALALAFMRPEAMNALREYVSLGFYSEYLGLPDAILLNGLPDGIDGIPSYRHFDLNIGALGMAIDQANEGVIANLYRSDPEINSALEVWESRSASDFMRCENGSNVED